MNPAKFFSVIALIGAFGLLCVPARAQLVISSTEITLDGKKYKLDVTLTPVPSNGTVPTPLPVGAPATPENLAAAVVSPTEVKLTWLDKSNNEGAFVIYRKVGGTGTFVKIGDTVPNAVSYSDKTASAKTSYDYVIRSWNQAGGASKASNMASVTTPEVSGGGVTDPVSVGLVYGVLDVGGASIRMAKKNSAVTLQGTNLGVEGTVSFAGVGATVVRWSNTSIEVVLPDVTAFTVGKITTTPAGRNPIVSVFDFAITLGLPDDPIINASGVVIDSLSTVPGRLSDVFFVGEQLAINGYGFGASGRLYLNGIEVKTDSWMETRIVATLPNLPNTHHNMWLTVYHSPERYLSTRTNCKLVP